MLRCSTDWGASGFGAPGEPSWSDILMEFGDVVESGEWRVGDEEVRCGVRAVEGMAGFALSLIFESELVK